MERQELIKKIEDLPPDRLAELEKFVESITRDEHAFDQELLHRALADYANMLELKPILTRHSRLVR